MKELLGLFPEEIKAELDYQRNIEQIEHDALYEPTYDPETGAM